MLSAAKMLEVPEPSPLFWDHVSARVRDAVAAEDPHASIGAWWRPSTWPRLALPAAGGVIAALVLAMMLTSRGLEQADDPSLGLVTALAAQMDWDAVSAVDVSTHAGAMDEAIGELSAGERMEMRRLLQAELARPGA